MSFDSLAFYLVCCYNHVFTWRLIVSKPVWPFPAYPNPKDPGPNKGKQIPFNPDNEEDSPW